MKEQLEELPVGTAHARVGRGLVGVFASTLFQLSGVFMLTPLVLLLLKRAEVSSTVAGLFASTEWLGVLLMTPAASTVVRHLGRLRALWLASVMPCVAVLGFLLTENLWIWFVLALLSGMSGGLRWVLAEAYIAGFAPPEQRGRFMGLYASMVGATFVIGPSLLAAVGAYSPYALWVVLGLLVIGLGWTAFIPPTPTDADTHSAAVGLKGVQHALQANPLIMFAGFMGGFFELGLASILPLYGLALGLSASAAALLIAVSGAGGTLAALPAGMLADRLAHLPKGRRRMLAALAATVLLATMACFALPNAPWMVWVVVALWGAAGGALYTVTMIDIGMREQGITLVNSTAVLVLSYTLGALAASAISGALIEWSYGLAFPVMLLFVSGVGLFALARRAQTPPERLPY